MLEGKPEIRGSFFIPLFEFVKEKYGKEKLEEFKKSIKELPEEIYDNAWYPLSLAKISMEKLKQMFEKYSYGKKDICWELGRKSCEYMLNTFYKFLMKFISPSVLLRRASDFLIKYHKPSDVRVINSGPKFIKAELEFADNLGELIIRRICGWVERFLEYAKCKNIIVRYKNYPAKAIVIIEVSWE